MLHPRTAVQIHSSRHRSKDMCQEDWNLHLAAKENRLDIARALIARGDDFDTRDKDGRTPLYWAVQYRGVQPSATIT